MLLLPVAACPYCFRRYAAAERDVDAVLAASSELERHLVESHRLSYGAAYRISEGWALSSCEALLRERGAATG